MIRYASTTGGISPGTFSEAVLQGFAEDGGLFVPERIPKISRAQLEKMSVMSYPQIVFEMIRPFINENQVPEPDLKQIIKNSFAAFDHPNILPLELIDASKSLYSMELFHGPTLSFKDIAMGFLVHMMDYLLEKRQGHLSLILATTGDTGPAAAHAAAGRPTLDCWPLYPEGRISKEQELQMTTIPASNIHPVSVADCNDGGDDLDIVVSRLFASPGLKEKLRLSSVNSINWCRVMVQAAHYAWGYFQVCDTIGEPVDFSVPSGAFGNLFAGFLARQMGIPIHCFICANNENQTLHQVFSSGLFQKKPLCSTVSSAIDIVVPYNFWRFLYFASGCNPDAIRHWMQAFEKKGEIMLDDRIHQTIRTGFASACVSDDQTLATIRHFWESHQYLLDPHGAVAVRSALSRMPENNKMKTICLATAHPAKFPDVIRMALQTDRLPAPAEHPGIINARTRSTRKNNCDLSQLEDFLIRDITKAVDRRSAV